MSEFPNCRRLHSSVDQELGGVLNETAPSVHGWPSGQVVATQTARMTVVHPMALRMTRNDVKDRSGFLRLHNSVTRTLLFILLASFLSIGQDSSLHAASFVATEHLYFAGKYDECLEVSLAEFNRGVWNERWPEMAIRCLLTTGRYEEAYQVYSRAKLRFKDSLQIRLHAPMVHRFHGDAIAAQRELDEISALVRKSPWRYSSATDLVGLGRFFLENGGDARQVLELFFDRVRKANPKFADAYLATAELGVQKHDNQLAIEMLKTAAALSPFDPKVNYLLAQASDDPEVVKKAVEDAIKQNPRHIPTLLFQADRLISAERYEEAEEMLTKVLEVNLFHPQAWASHAAIAHVQGCFQAEKILREIALSNWKSNPAVDTLIGSTLSQKYRFAEGAEYQRRALKFDPDYVPAKFNLAQDLLRLGKDDDGWKIAHEVHDTDAYNVVAYNLVTLHDSLKKFTTINNDHFALRMEAKEATIYGAAVLELLEEARQKLGAKYDVDINEPVVVEIFPQQKDFAIRTFGMPGGAGYLGVCFGRLITANSPASQGPDPSNWKSVLWHEYCHVITLEKTKNRMPRWLSEGISVYEERQRDPSWGEQLTPRYREMLLGEELTPVGELSGAFLRPKSPLHLQFAYYESSLVVEFLIQEYGIDILNKILIDLGIGMPINDSIQRYVGSLKEFEERFADYAFKTARGLAPKLEFQTVELPTSMVGIERLQKELNNNYWVQHAYADALIAVGDWSGAKRVLEKLHAAYPGDSTAMAAARKLAKVFQETGDVKRREVMLVHLASIDNKAIGVLSELMQIDQERKDWKSLYAHAGDYLAVQPLTIRPHMMMADASKQLGLDEDRIRSLTALLQLDPVDPAAVHFELATALEKTNRQHDAKRQVLKALEFAPRYRDAQQLLLRLIEQDQTVAAEVTEVVAE